VVDGQDQIDCDTNATNNSGRQLQKICNLSGINISNLSRINFQSVQFRLPVLACIYTYGLMDN
jgi:hypothetical protein